LLIRRTVLFLSILAILFTGSVRAKHVGCTDYPTLLDALDDIFSACKGGPELHYLKFMPNTEPPSDWICAKSALGKSAAKSDYYTQEITEADKNAGFVKLPRLIVEARGHLPYEYEPQTIKLDNEFWNNRYESDNRIYHSYMNTSKIALRRDPNYQEPETPNHVLVKVYSEPSGAEIYCAGKLLGKTPLRLKYTLDDTSYMTGKFKSIPLTAVVKGYEPKELMPVIKIHPDWKYKSGHTFEAEQGVHFPLRRGSIYHGYRSGYTFQRSKTPRSGFSSAESSHARSYGEL
jgi:hypothetical protein